MKKSVKILIILFVIIVMGVLLFTLNFFSSSKDITSDEKEFKKEYESFNGNKTPDNKEMLTIKIPLKNKIKYISEKEVLMRLTKGTSIIYFGFPTCPWCRNLVPELLKVNEAYDLQLYYFNALDIRDKKHLSDDKKVVTDKEGSKEYKEILDILGDKASSYEGLEDDSIKRLYFPTVVFIKEGEVIDIYEGTVDSQTDPYVELSKKQKEELHKNLEKYFDEVSTSVCDKDRSC